MKTEIAGDVLLDVKNANVRFDVGGGQIRALDDVSIQLKRGEALAVVGESGCGKSLTLHAIAGVLPPTARLGEQSRILLDGRDLTRLNDAAARRLLGAEIGMIFQDPNASLNPLLSIGDHLLEVLALNYSEAPSDLRRKAIDFLLRRGFAQSAAYAAVRALPFDED